MPGLFQWGAKKGGEPASATATPVIPETLTTSKVLPKFLSALSHQSSPALLDLGPVVGANVAFFGDRLACKIQVEDFFADLEAQARRGTRDGLWETLSTRLSRLASSYYDGILCWDLFDYLDRATAQALAARLAKLLRPGGVLYGFFGTTPVELTHYTRFIVVDETTFKQRTSPATKVQRGPLLNRDITRMFDPLVVTESVLLKTSTRETLFRKGTG